MKKRKSELAGRARSYIGARSNLARVVIIAKRTETKAKERIKLKQSNAVHWSGSRAQLQFTRERVNAHASVRSIIMCRVTEVAYRCVQNR